MPNSAYLAASSAIGLVLASTAVLAADEPQSTSTVAQVIVTAPRKEATARLQQLVAPNVVNVQSAETIAKYPDVNAAEALSRIPGVSLSIDTGEGRFVTVRGIDSNLDGATFGGVVLLNSFPGGTYFAGTGRAVEFDTTPIGAVDRIAVTKTGLPDHEAEGIGGSIDLIPRSAQAITKPFAEVEIAGGYQSLRGSTAPIQEQVTVGTRFGPNKTWSVVFTQFQHNDRRAIDDFEEAYGSDNPDGNGNTVSNLKVYDSAEFRRYNYFRRRFGYGGELDFDPSPDHHYYLRGNSAGYTENVNRQRFILNNMEYDGSGNSLVLGAPVCALNAAGPCTFQSATDPTGFVSPAAGAQATLRDQQETHKNTLVAWGGEDRFNGFSVEYQGAFTEADYHKPYDRNWTFNNVNTLSLAYNNVANANFPTFKVLAGGNPLDPTTMALTGFGNSQETDHDREWSGSGAVSIPLKLVGSDDELKFGFKLRFREKEVNPTSQSYSIAAGQTLANFEGGGPYTYYDGLYQIGFRPNGLTLLSYFMNTPGAFSGGERTSRDLGGYYLDNENVYAGFAQYRAKIGKLGVLAGVRVESTDATYRGYLQTNDPGSSVPGNTLIGNHQSYVNVFPTVQFRYEFRPNLIGRLTYSTGIARPGFTQVTASTQVDVGGGTVSTGNPNLKPTYGHNFDASVEWYLPGAGILSLGVFDKELRNYIVTRTITANTYLGDNQIWHISTYLNAPAYARGLEAQWVQKFVWAPGLLKHFGVDANATYVDSQVDLFAGQKALLPGTSRWTGNAAFYYEDGRFQSRVALTYVGKNLFTVGGSQETNVYEVARVQLDWTNSYQVTRNVQLFFNIKDLNNEGLKFYEGSPDRLIQREFYLQSFEFGLKARF